MGVYLICGSGRWARAYYTILAEMFDGHGTARTRTDRPCVIVVSSRLAAGEDDWHSLSNDHDLDFMATVPPRPAGSSPPIAIVASSAAAHAAHVHDCLAKGWNVLVEKPFLVCDSAEREAILAEAKESRLALAGSFVWTFADAIRMYSAGCSLADIKHIVVDWADPPGEIRYGQSKTYDIATSVLADVWPHAHGILEAVGVNIDPATICVGFAGGGQRAELSGSLGPGADLTITLARNAAERVRRLSLTYRDGTVYALDFAESSAAIVHAPPGATPTTRAVVQGPKRPLRLQLEAFVELALSSDKEKRARARQAIETVCGALDLLVEAWIRHRRAFLKSSVTEANLFGAPDFRFALKEELAERASRQLSEGGWVDHRLVDLQVSAVLKRLPVVGASRSARLRAFDFIMDDVTLTHDEPGDARR